MFANTVMNGLLSVAARADAVGSGESHAKARRIYVGQGMASTGRDAIGRHLVGRCGYLCTSNKPTGDSAYV